MNKIAILLLCHKNFKQVNLLISQFNSNYYDIFVHVDAKAKILTSQIKKADNIYFIEDSVVVNWGDISQVDAIIKLLKVAKEHASYLYYWLISGQDLLLLNSKTIYTTLVKTPENNYLTLFKDEAGKFHKRVELYYPNYLVKNTFIAKVLKNAYMILTGGRNKTFSIFKRKFSASYNFAFSYTWFCFNDELVSYILDFIIKNPSYYQAYKTTICPDESFIATIVNNSPYHTSIKEGLVYVDWSEHKRSPKTLTLDDYEIIAQSGYYLARKFDMYIDNNIIEKIYNNSKK